MPKDKYRVPGPGARVEVVVPARTRGMKGWAMLAPGETSEPRQSWGLYDVKEQNILPGRRRGPPEDSARRGPEGEQKPKRRALEKNRSFKQETETEMRREIARLRIENDLYALAESEQTRRLRAEVEHLESVKVDLKNRLLSSAAETTPASAETEESLLRSKDREIRDQVSFIRDLERTLSRYFEQERLRLEAGDIDLPTNVSSIGDAMEAIKRGIVSAADLLSSSVHPPDKTPRRSAVDPKLRDLLKITGHNNRALRLMPELAFRAILFRIVCDQILCSEIWGALHTEGFLLRAYQRAIQHASGNEFAGIFHKAALLHMVQHDAQFETCFLAGHVKELQQYTIEVLGPLLDPAKLRVIKDDLFRVMHNLFLQAFSFRAKSLPPDGVRYEVIQFNPGEPFNHETMEAHDTTDNQYLLSDLDNGTRRQIKLCVHGMVVAHRLQDGEPEGLRKVKAIGEAFSASRNRPGSGLAGGDIVTKKAIVILD
ncbi:hypothetical protein ASPVEDRAFT_136404 [Aspergillus versicolor CBS 583.65]|uniref:Uncharacterized protein n=1 Tax=Aspergillus versicolor CBS 583.65 TaxID=1036611 RepID=A0A1L9PRE4_ASPVE|nr:uncharacterized protein ASPVEDRAFT_136404 [Aspergillus versicolor CBS 583.65]OJJ04016.1 hypothetical protein ASPVEDRAFT_136404 [Aspergillus versicolor CBS 583.65]